MKKNNIPENLYNLRKKAGLSQEEFADKLYVSRQAVSKWERGEAYPDTENLIAISELFGITIDALLNERIDVFATSDAKEDATNQETKAEVSNKISYDDDDDYDEEDDDDEDDQTTSRRGAISALYALPYPILTTVVFLAIGFLADGWVWAWTLFITIPVYYSLLDAIRKRRLCDFAYPVFLAFIYCLLGMLCGWWHPGWLIFITIPIYYPIAEAIDKLIRKNNR